MKKILTILILLLLVGVGCNETKLGADLHPDVEMKADAEDIISSETEDGVVTYFYDTKIPIPFGADEELTDYAIKEGYTIVDEIIEKRTTNARVFNVLDEENSSSTMGEFIPGVKQYYKKLDGDWTQQESATTTEEVFDLAMKPTLLEKFVGLFDEKVLGASGDPIYINGSGVDGTLDRATVNEVFDTIRNGAGTGVNYTSSDMYAAKLSSSATTNQYVVMTRGVYVFDTRIIGAGQQIDSGSLSIYGRSTSADDLGGNGEVGITTATTASTSTLTNSDFQATTSEVRLADSDIDVGSWTSIAYNIFTLNQTGLDNIDMEDYSYFASRLNFDIDDDDTGIVWGSQENIMPRSYMSERTGTANDPKLILFWSAEAVSGFRPPTEEILEF